MEHNYEALQQRFKEYKADSITEIDDLKQEIKLIKEVTRHKEAKLHIQFEDNMKKVLKNQ